MNNNEQQAVIHVHEEHARIGRVDVTKKTVIAATDEGVIAYTINTVSQASVPAAVAQSPRPALPCPQSVVVVKDSPPSSDEFSCVDCCFRCDGDYPWYSLNGKGFCLVLLLLLGYLIAGVLLLALWLIATVLACLCSSDRD